MELRKLGILIGVIVAVAVTLSIVLIPTLFENYSGTLSLISLLVAIAMFFYQQDREKRIKVEELHDTLSRWCNAFRNDIAQIRKEITSDKYEKVMNNNGKTSTTVFLSTKIYDAFIYSGYITHFETDTQVI